MALTFCIFLLPAEPLFLTVELFVDSDEQTLSYDPVIFVCDRGFLSSDEYDHQPGPICFTSSRNHSLSLFLVVKASYFPILISSSFYFPTSSVCNPSWSNRCSKFIPIREKYTLLWSSTYMGSRGWVQNFCLFAFHIFLSVPVSLHPSALSDLGHPGVPSVLTLLLIQNTLLRLFPFLLSPRCPFPSFPQI